MRRNKNDRRQRDPWAIEFGERLVRLISDSGMTRASLAEACGFAKSNVDNYARGYAEPSAHRVALMATALGVSSDELLGLEYE